MLPTTGVAVRALLKSDPTLTPSDRQRIVNTIREHGRLPDKLTTTPTVEPPRVLRRAEAAERLKCCRRTVDSLTRGGFLHKVLLPGRVRSIGVRESDVCDLINRSIERDWRDGQHGAVTGDGTL